MWVSLSYLVRLIIENGGRSHKEKNKVKQKVWLFEINRVRKPYITTSVGDRHTLYSDPN
jgi:hypothetical protein